MPAPCKVERPAPEPAYANLQWRKPREVWRGGASDAMGIWRLSRASTTRKAATVRSTVTRRITRHGCCQDSFSRPVLSSAANLAAYLRAGTGMKPRSPVNFDLATVNQISPAAQAGLREFRRRGIMRERHPAPIQRLHMHRPERLRRLVAFVRRQLERSSPALSPTFFVLGFGKDFSVLRTDLAASASVMARSQRVNVVSVRR